MEQKISKEELDERVAILKKFRMLLEQQRKKFQEYLKVPFVEAVMKVAEFGHVDMSAIH